MAEKILASGMAAAFSIVALATSTTPAAAQQMTGHLDPQLYANIIMQMNQGNNACGPMSESEIDEARLPAPGIMQGYFDAAQAGEPISPHFKLNRRTSWAARNGRGDQDTLDAQSDPLAVPGNRLDPETLRFFRAGTHQTAQGQWLVLGPDDSVVGVYTAMFERERGEWKLLKLTVHDADHSVSPILHYCSEPGDLVQRRTQGLRSRVDQLRQRVTSRRDRLERANERLGEALASAAENPNSSRRERRVAERRTQVCERQESLSEALVEWAEARQDLTEAVAERFEVIAQTTQARNARSFRLLGDDGLPMEGIEVPTSADQASSETQYQDPISTKAWEEQQRLKSKQ